MPYDEHGRHIRNASARQWADYHRKKKRLGSSSAVRRASMSDLRRKARRYKSIRVNKP